MNNVLYTILYCTNVYSTGIPTRIWYVQYKVDGKNEKANRSGTRGRVGLAWENEGGRPRSTWKRTRTCSRHCCSHSSSCSESTYCAYSINYLRLCVQFPYIFKCTCRVRVLWDYTVVATQRYLKHRVENAYQSGRLVREMLLEFVQLSLKWCGLRRRPTGVLCGL